MRFLVILMLALLAGCQSSKDNPTHQFAGKFAPSGTLSLENGTIRVFGKSWGEYGRAIARKVAYKRLYEKAKRYNYSHFVILSEKPFQVKKGTLSLLPLATKTQDYHSVRLSARLYRGSRGTPSKAKRIESLRSLYNKSIESAAVPERKPFDPGRFAKRKAKPVTAKPSPKPVKAEKPEIVEAEAPAEKPKKLPKKQEIEDEPLVILAPKS